MKYLFPYSTNNCLEVLLPHKPSMGETTMHEAIITWYVGKTAFFLKYKSKQVKKQRKGAQT